MKKTSDKSPQWLTVRDIAFRMQISYEKALAISKYEIGCIRVGRQSRIPEENFSRYIKALTRRAG